MGELFKYFGIDWLAMTFTFLGIWQVGNKNPAGFIIMMFGNTCWMGLAILTESIAMILANFGFFAMNMRALRKWTRPSITANKETVDGKA